MKDLIAARLPTLAYGLMAAVVAGLVVGDFNRARECKPVHDTTTLPLVTRERALGRGDRMAGLTRSSAIILALPASVLVWPMVRTAWQGRSIGRLILLGLAAFSPWIGYLLYAGYLQIASGDWRANQFTNRAGWGSGLSFDPVLLLTKLPGKGLKLFWASDASCEYIAWSWVVALAVSVFAFIAFWEARAPRWHAAFLIGFWGLVALAYQGNAPLVAMGRYTSVVFPLYVAGALFAQKRPWARPVLLAASVVGLTLTTIWLFAGYHIN